MLQFDGENHHAQSAEQFPWGTDAQHIRDLNLRLREFKPAQDKNSTVGGDSGKSQSKGKKSFGGNRKPGGGGESGRKSEFDITKLQICQLFNVGKCTNALPRLVLTSISVHSVAPQSMGAPITLLLLWETSVPTPRLIPQRGAMGLVPRN